MMGVNHATTGAAAWIVVASGAPLVSSGLYTVDTVGVFAGAIVCAGAALLPDADHHNGTIANSVPFLGKIAASGVGKASGGHRGGLHSVLGIAAALVGSILLDKVTLTTEMFGALPIGAGIATMALIAFAAKALKLTKGNWVMPWLLGLAIALFIVFFSPTNLTWLPIAITLCYVVHLLGDFLTTDGIGWLWPLKPVPPLWWQDIPFLNKLWKKNGHFALPLLGNAGSVREWIFGGLVGLYIVAALIQESFWAFGLNIIDLLV